MSFSDIAFLYSLEGIIKARIDSPSEESYTARLVAAGTKRIAQKVGEEGVELALAAVAGDQNEIIDEAADLLYHVIVLLSVEDLGLKQVCDRLKTRHGGTWENA